MSLKTVLQPIAMVLVSILCVIWFLLYMIQFLLRLLGVPPIVIAFLGVLLVIVVIRKALGH